MVNVDHNSVAGDQLLQFINRVERLIEERKGINGDIREVMAEAKACGFDPKIIRQCIKIRAQDTARRKEEQELLDLYLHAIGLI